MVNPTPAENSTTSSPVESQNDAATPLRCFLGALISSAIATLLYFLMVSIHQKFATTPIPSSSVTAVKISIAVRTLVVGMSALGTVTFGIATLGLTGLGIQLLIQRQSVQNHP